MRSLARSAALAPVLMLALALACGGARAVDTDPGYEAADLAPVRSMLKAQDYRGALEALMVFERDNRSADLYNLLGFSLRKLGELNRAAAAYRRALSLDPDHRGTLEYQGQLFLMIGEPARALDNLRRLEVLCPQGCEERAELEKAIRAAGVE